MEDAEIALMFSLVAIPVAICLQIWVRNRKHARKNTLGEGEFENTGQAFISIMLEGVALVGGLIMILMATGGILKYLASFYTS